MNPRDLLKAALDLVGSANGKPRQANLLRATSTVYYALFHTLAKCGADMVIGGAGASRDLEAWKRVYRSLQHGVAKDVCKNGGLTATFPQAIQDFCNLFVTMQAKRQAADYDPDAKAYKSEVLLDIRQAEAVIDGFDAAPIKDRRAFAAHVLFRARPK